MNLMYQNIWAIECIWTAELKSLLPIIYLLSLKQMCLETVENNESAMSCQYNYPKFTENPIVKCMVSRP